MFVDLKVRLWNHNQGFSDIYQSFSCLEDLHNYHMNPSFCFRVVLLHSQHTSNYLRRKLRTRLFPNAMAS